MKKYFNLIAFGASALFGIIILLCMIGNGIRVETFLGTGAASVYRLSFGDGNDNANAGLIIAFIFVILALLGAIGLAALDFLKKEVPFVNFIAMGLGLLAFVGSIFYFSTAAVAGYRGDIAGGAVFAAIFDLLSALVLIGWGVVKQFNLLKD